MKPSSADAIAQAVSYGVLASPTAPRVYGNKSSGKAMTIDITSDIVSKINWDGFPSDNLESIATNYWCHKSLRD